MKLILSTALTATLLGAATFAVADGHADVTNVTCAQFADMTIADQESLLAELTAAVDGAENDDIKIGDVQVICNGSEDETLADLLRDRS